MQKVAVKEISSKHDSRYLVLDGLVVGLLKPGAEDDGVVGVTQRSKQRRRRVGGIVS